MHIMRPNKNDKISAQFDMDHLRPNLLEEHGKFYALHQTFRVAFACVCFRVCAKILEHFSNFMSFLQRSSWM